jgi:hypothetical protein
MTGEREDITLYTDHATKFQSVKEEVENDLGTSLSKSQVVAILISSSDYGPST